MPDGSPGNGYNYVKVAFFIGGLVVAGYATYRLVRTCISLPAATASSASSDISQAVVERIHTIVIPRPVSPYNPLPQLPTPQLTFAQLPTSQLYTPQLPTPPAEEVSKAVTGPPMMFSLVSAAGAAYNAIIRSIYRAWNWIVGVKNSDAASALGTTITSTANFVASASREGVSKVGKWATDLKAPETESTVGSHLASSANSLASASVKVGEWASEFKDYENKSSLISTLFSAAIKTVFGIFSVIIKIISVIIKIIKILCKIFATLIMYLS